tara:strand:+ start:2519 stop:3199 length:681 start_codon:yes stop_codon:yes gene_type:complete
MKAVAIIPARGGSKRIPRKNIRKFCGKPIIAYSIHKARASNLFSRVIVSTDDLEIAGIAKTYGAEVDLRPARLADDYTTLSDVMRYEAASLPNDENAVCFILATALFFSVSDLYKGKELLDISGTLFTLPVQRFPAPIERAFTRNKSGQTQMLDPSKYATRSQDCVESYYDAGQFYWGLRSSWVNPPLDFFGPHTASFELASRFCVDIDDSSDWEFAERVYPLLNS